MLQTVSGQDYILPDAFLFQVIISSELVLEEQKMENMIGRAAETETEIFV